MATSWREGQGLSRFRSGQDWDAGARRLTWPRGPRPDASGGERSSCWPRGPSEHGWRPAARKLLEPDFRNWVGQ